MFAREGQMRICLRRREFIGALGGAAVAWPLVARAEQPVRMRRVAVFMAFTENDAVAQALLQTFKSALRVLGWTDGGNLRVDARFAANPTERLRLAQEVVALSPDVILANSPAVPALREVTATIPIVYVGGADPVGDGFVESLPRPAGNITGFSNNAASIATKHLQLLKEVAPKISRVAYLYDPEQPGWSEFQTKLAAAAPLLRIAIWPAVVRNSDDIARAFEQLAREPNPGVFVYSSGAAVAHRDLIIILAARYGIPSVFGFRFFVTGGGLVSYGVDISDQYRRAASYVDRILRGANPSELPAQLPTKFELVINLKTAKALGLAVPPTLRALADEVIE
jgi:putative ABC transport system substrate-binding protein